MRNPIRMKSLVVGMGLVLLVALCAQAQTVPTMMSYQGRLSANGTNFNGTGYFKFALVSADGMTTYWSNDASSGGLEPAFATAVPVSNGLFTVMLGDTWLPHMMYLDPTAFQNGRSDAHLRIWFGETEDGAFAQLAPDQPLGSVGYAMMAATVGPGAVGASELAGNSVTEDKIDNKAVTADKIAEGVITSNKIDWSTMPAIPNWKGYKENGAFETAPVASGINAIAMGFGARAAGDYATVGGGDRNSANDEFATVGGGYTNVAGGQRATVAGGIHNVANGFSASIGGGSANAAAAEWATIGGGLENAIHATAPYGVIGGGFDNGIASDATNATVAGGWSNNIGASSTFSAIGGGAFNGIGDFSERATVAGGYSNNIGANSSYGVISGGHHNNIESNANGAAVVGGMDNNIGAHSSFSTIGGGFNNSIVDSERSIVGGGSVNGIGMDSDDCVINGGSRNSIGSNSSFATIGGGFENHVYDGLATVGGGFFNIINVGAADATIPGGSGNRIGVSATNAFAAGRHANANHVGAFVWGDYSSEDDIASTNANSVTMRAHGGYRLFTAAGVGAQLPPGLSSWSSLSDRNAKENFEPIDTAEILEKVAVLPLTAWNYKADPNRRRFIGPVAQDFHAAFGLGDDTSINTLDTDGVTLAAIQALNRKVEGLAAENADLKARLERLEAGLAP